MSNWTTKFPEEPGYYFVHGPEESPADAAIFELGEDEPDWMYAVGEEDGFHVTEFKDCFFQRVKPLP